MPIRTIRVLALSALLTLILCLPVRAQEDTNPLTHIVIISVDGARPDAIQQVDTPYIDALAERGAFSWSARTVFPPATLPAHASLLSGLDPAVHGADDNVVRDCGDFAHPTLLSLADEAGYATAMAVGKGPLCQFRTTDETAFTLGASGDRSVVDAAIALLADGAEVIFVHLPNPDYFGHLTGWMSNTYLWELRNTDAQIGRLLQALDEMALTETTFIILTADHGGHDMEHGQDIPEDMTIPFIMAGPGVRADFDLSDPDLPPVTLLDIAPTVLWLLDIPAPDALTGRVQCEAFAAPLAGTCDPGAEE